MSPRFVFGRENVPCVAEVVNRSLKANCTDFNNLFQASVCPRLRPNLDLMVTGIQPMAPVLNRGPLEGI